MESFKLQTFLMQYFCNLISFHYIYETKSHCIKLSHIYFSSKAIQCPAVFFSFFIFKINPDLYIICPCLARIQKPFSPSLLPSSYTVVMAPFILSRFLTLFVRSFFFWHCHVFSETVFILTPFSFFVNPPFYPKWTFIQCVSIKMELSDMRLLGPLKPFWDIPCYLLHLHMIPGHVYILQDTFLCPYSVAYSPYKTFNMS